MNTYNITVFTEDGKKVISSDQILYVESSLQFTRITLTNNEVVELLLTLSEVNKILSTRGFFKLSNSLLVNLKYIEMVFPSNASKIIMENGRELFVNYNRREELFENLREVYDLHELV